MQPRGIIECMTEIIPDSIEKSMTMSLSAIFLLRFNNNPLGCAIDSDHWVERRSTATHQLILLLIQHIHDMNLVSMIISSWSANEKRLHSKGSWTTQVSVSVNSWAVLWASMGDILTDRSASMTNRCYTVAVLARACLSIRMRSVVKQGQKNGFDWSTGCVAGVCAGCSGGALHGLWRPDMCRSAWPGHYACRHSHCCLFMHLPHCLSSTDADCVLRWHSISH